jgi:hypothetical protein
MDWTPVVHSIVKTLYWLSYPSNVKIENYWTSDRSTHDSFFLCFLDGRFVKGEMYNGLFKNDVNSLYYIALNNTVVCEQWIAKYVEVAKP